MKQKEAIKTLLKEKNTSQAALAEKMGYAHVSGVSQMLNRGNITVKTLYKICELMDYEITIQPKRKSGARPNGQITIEWDIAE